MTTETNEKGLAPTLPKIYHITHVNNLASIIADGDIVSDSAMMARGGPATSIGMSAIKKRRLNLPVRCHPGDSVGSYVPFYFCPRSIMLYVIHRGNHPDLKYQEGEMSIAHLEVDLHQAVKWADSVQRRWAFTLSNAGAHYAEFRSSLKDLREVDWNAVAATDFRDERVKEAKQAEFLIHGPFPWERVERIGVLSEEVKRKAEAAIGNGKHRPVVEIRRDWYY